MWAKFSFILLFILCFTGITGRLQAAKNDTQIKAIVFDFGGVFAKMDKSEVAEFIAKSLNISTISAAEALAQLKLHTMQEKSESSFWEAYANANQIKLPENWVDELDIARFHAIKIIPGMIALVKELQAQGYQTALLTNVRKSQAEVKSKLGFYELFNPALYSYEIGVSKPNPKAYEILLDRLKLPPAEVLFVDNKLINVEAAEKLGMDGIVFSNAETLIKDLKLRGINVATPAAP